MRREGKLRASIVGLGLLLALVSAGCGSSGDVTATVAGEEVTIAGDVDPSTFAITRELLRQTPFTSWYQRCIITQAEGVLSPAEAKRLTAIPRESERRKQRELDLLIKIGPACEKTNRNLIDPDAPPESFDLVRAQTSESMRLLFRKEGFGEAKQVCAAEAVLETSNEEYTSIMNSNAKARETRFLRLISPCL
jgi:hypothetical protein